MLKPKPAVMVKESFDHWG